MGIINQENINKPDVKSFLLNRLRLVENNNCSFCGKRVDLSKDGPTAQILSWSLLDNTNLIPYVYADRGVFHALPKDRCSGWEAAACWMKHEESFKEFLEELTSGNLIYVPATNRWSFITS